MFRLSIYCLAMRDLADGFYRKGNLRPNSDSRTLEKGEYVQHGWNHKGLKGDQKGKKEKGLAASLWLMQTGTTKISSLQTRSAPAESSADEEITGAFNTEGLGSAAGPLSTGEGTWTCPRCGLIFESREQCFLHMRATHLRPDPSPAKPVRLLPQLPTDQDRPELQSHSWIWRDKHYC